MFPLRTAHRPVQKLLSFIFLITFFATTAVARSSSAQENDSNCFMSQWPSQSSTLIPDPSLVRGKLENGFRYVLKKNKEPEDRVAIYLYVQAGSLNEGDDQRGVAHFLEHMMFNGSRNFPPGSLIDYFQSLGMNFGGDTNARTSHTETVYNIILPNGSEKDLKSGLLVMADYARGALLLDSEIDKERGVILAEKRARDSAGYRSNIASTEFALSGTKYPVRMPIGIDKILQEADHDKLKSFYDAWYRPENMILVVVGDIDPGLTVALVEKQFAELSGAGQKPQCPDFGKLTPRGLETFYHYEPELGETNVAIQSMWDLSIENDSLELEKKELLQLLGSMIINDRLKRLQEEEKVPFAYAGYSSGDILNRVGYASLSAKVDAKHWQETLETLDRILRQAILHGFRKSEIERVKKEILAQLETRVLTEDSEDSRTIARRIIDHLDSNRVYQSAEQEKALYGPLIKEITLAEVNQAFRERWSHESRLISVTGDVSLGENGIKDISSVYLKSTRQPVEASLSDKRAKFPYLHPSGPAASPQIVTLQDINVERLVFPNGLRVNLKKTQFEENRIRIRADFGAGEQNESAPGVAMLAEAVVNQSGTGQLSQSAMDELIVGSSIQLSFNINESSFSWTGTTLTKDFALFSQILYHLLRDAGFRESVFNTVKEKYELMYQKMTQEIEGAVPLTIQPFLADYSARFGLPPWADVVKLDYDTVHNWVQSYVKSSDLEISVVGDFNRDDVVSVLEKYFSVMELSSPQLPASPPIHFPVAEKLDEKVSTSVEKSLVVVAWPTDDFWDIHRTRRLHLLASVFQDRLRKIIREKLAASYSPHVSSYNSRVYQGYGYITAQVLVSPGAEDIVVQEILKISDQLKREGITSDELVRAREPLLTTLKGTIRTNQYWLNSVLSLSARYPQQLHWPSTIISDYAEINENEINKMAALYLDNNSAALARITPDREKKNNYTLIGSGKNHLSGK